MNKLLIVICILILLPALAMSQEPDQRTKARGFAFVAPGIAVGEGSTTGFLHFGGGGEANLYRGFGVGSEIGYLAPVHYMSQGVGAFSMNGLYNHEKPGSKINPFITFGYTLVFRSGHINAMNFGGGADYWFKKGAGVRFEFNDYFSPRYFGDHLLQGRVALVFR